MFRIIRSGLYSKLEVFLLLFIIINEYSLFGKMKKVNFFNPIRNAKFDVLKKCIIYLSLSNHIRLIIVTYHKCQSRFFAAYSNTYHINSSLLSNINHGGCCY